jgi:surfeit locus 1 family protein
MTVVAIPTLAILLYLGTWQVLRMEWKESLIDEFTLRATAEAITPPVADKAAEMRYQRLEVSGVWLHEDEVQLTGRLFEGTAGYHVITPMRLDDGRVLILNRGWVSQDFRRPESRPSSLDSGRVSVEAILRLPFRKGYFVPENNPGQDDWFTLNIDDIAAHHELGDRVIRTFSADVLRPDGPYVLPIGAGIDINIPNDHWNYALTWYGIALGLIGVYLTWHVQAGRLRLSKRTRRK